jgi:porin
MKSGSAIRCGDIRGTGKSIRIGILRFLSALLLAWPAAPALAGEDAAPGYVEDTLSGDWNGLRSDWYRQGLAVDLGYKWDMLRVANGGLRRGGRPIGHFDLRAKGDLGKLLGWEDTTAFVNLIYDGGGKTNTDNLGSLLGVSNIEVPVSTARFYQAWIERSYAGGKWSLLAGLYPIDTEFQALESAGLFLQPPYGAAPDLALTRGPSIFNNPALGMRAKWQSEDKNLYAMAAVLDGIPGDPDKPKGTHVRLRAGDGTMQIAEFGYWPPASEADGKALFNKYAMGYWSYSAKVDDLVDVDAGGAPQRRSSSGWYALAERTLWHWGTGNLSGFVRYGETDGNSTAIDAYYSLGVRIRGLLPGREDDVFGIAHTRASVGDKFRVSQLAAGISATTAESATEITYRIQVNKWLALQPAIQWYRNPGADSAVPDATVLGLRLELAL